MRALSQEASMNVRQWRGHIELLGALVQHVLQDNVDVNISAGHPLTAKLQLVFACYGDVAAATALARRAVAANVLTGAAAP